MKSQGIDHVAIVVKDMDRTVETLSSLFEVEFKEIIEAKERLGVRISVSVPDLQLELMAVVDPVKAKSSVHGREIAEFAERVGEGIYRIFVRVEDAEQALADAKTKGINTGRKVEEKLLGGFIPHFKEVTFSRESGMPVFGIGLIEYVG